MEEMATLTVQVPAALLDLEMEQSEIEASVTKALALKLFAAREITAGTAARLLGVDRMGLLNVLRRHGIPYYADLTAEEVNRQLRASAEARSKGSA